MKVKKEEHFVHEMELDNLNKFDNYISNTNDFYILQMNIRSLNANINGLNIIIEKLKIKLSVVICTETWNLVHNQLVNIDGYKMYHNDSHINRSDGVVIYIKSVIQHRIDIEVAGGDLIILSCTINLDSLITVYT